MEKEKQWPSGHVVVPASHPDPVVAVAELNEQIGGEALDFVLFFCSAAYDPRTSGARAEAHVQLRPVIGCTSAGRSDRAVSTVPDRGRSAWRVARGMAPERVVSVLRDVRPPIHRVLVMSKGQEITEAAVLTLRRIHAAHAAEEPVRVRYQTGNAR